MPFEFVWSEFFFIFEAPTPPSEVEVTYLSGETVAEPVLPARSIQLSVNGADYPLQLVGHGGQYTVLQQGMSRLAPPQLSVPRKLPIPANPNQPAFTYPVNPIEDKAREKWQKTPKKP